MHERQAIREAVVAQLIGAVTVGPTTTYATSAGARVSKSRIEPVKAGSELPTISVYTDEESVDPSSAKTATRELTRSVNVAIEAWTAAGDGLDDSLDALALEIETAMDADVNLDDTAYDCVLASTEFGFKPEGNRPMGVVRLVYTVTYHTDLRTEAADAAREDLETIGVEYSLSGEQAEADRAVDLIDGLEE